jgi:hypothetical protein
MNNKQYDELLDYFEFYGKDVTTKEHFLELFYDSPDIIQRVNIIGFYTIKRMCLHDLKLHK